MVPARRPGALTYHERPGSRFEGKEKNMNIMLTRWVRLCAVLALGWPVLLQADAPLPLDPARAHLYLLRPDLGANEIRVTVSVNGAQAGSLESNQYLVFSLPPGTHDLALEAAGNTLARRLDLQAGAEQYLYLQLQSSSFDYAMTARAITPDYAARYLIRTPAAAETPVRLSSRQAPPSPAPGRAEEPAPHAVPPAPAPAAGPALPGGISLVTLGVSDLPASVAFYSQGLGLRLSAHSNRDIAFFELDGSWLALYPREALAADAGVPSAGPGGFAGFTLAHNLASAEAVDAFMARAGSAGAQIVKPPAQAFWGGYSGYFRDPDGFLWEVAWNPRLPLRQGD